jgi:hypothetical protein
MLNYKIISSSKKINLYKKIYKKIVDDLDINTNIKIHKNVFYLLPSSNKDFMNFYENKFYKNF